MREETRFHSLPGQVPSRVHVERTEVCNLTCLRPDPPLPPCQPCLAAWNGWHDLSPGPYPAGYPLGTHAQGIWTLLLLCRKVTWYSAWCLCESKSLFENDIFFPLIVFIYFFCIFRHICQRLRWENETGRPGYRRRALVKTLEQPVTFFYCLKTNPGLTGSDAKTAARVVVQLDGKWISGPWGYS